MTIASDCVHRLLFTTPDFPKPGILFRELSPVLADAEAFRAIIDELVSPFAGRIDLVAGIEARGFTLAAAAAYATQTGMLVVRKSGKLPGDVLTETYDLEYGSASLDLYRAPVSGKRVLILDDLLATGGTLAASIRLCERAGYKVVGVGVVIELAGLFGRDALPGRHVRSIVSL